MTRYGYARVSTKDQKLDRQIEALVNAGVPYGHIYKDKVTGAKDGDRTQQKRLFKKMKAGDEVVVESWERLTRSTRQLLNYDLMFRNLGVKLTSLKQPRASPSSEAAAAASGAARALQTSRPTPP